MTPKKISERESTSKLFVFVLALFVSMSFCNVNAIVVGGKTNQFANATFDEIAVWNKTLSDSDALNLYKRGIMDLNISVRSCDDAACNGEEWNETLTEPGALNVAENRYFQFQANFFTENSAYTPKLYNTTITYYDATKGLVSMVEGTNPFWTNTSNPYPITLGENESTLVTWFVKATGAVGDKYPFFAYANKTSNLSVGAATDKLNITIIGDTVLTLSDDTDTTTIYIGETDKFYASYTDGVSALSGASCTMYFSDDTPAMVYNETSSKYEYSRSFASNDTFAYNVTCSKTNYVTKTASDSATIAADITGPTVTNIAPSAGTSSYIFKTLEISADATDHSGVSSVKANITYPNSTIFVLTLNNVENTSQYNASFTIPELTGEYNITIIATDTLNNEDTTQTTYFNALHDILLAYPENNTAIIIRDPTFIWQDQNDASRTFQMQLSNDSEFSNLIVNETNIAEGSPNTTYALPFNLNASTYYWRVRAYNATYTYTWTPTYQFNQNTFVEINLYNSTLDFGQAVPGYEVNTSSNDSSFVIVNSGTMPVNITVTSTPLFTGSNTTNSYMYQLLNLTATYTNITSIFTDFVNVSSSIDVENLEWEEGFNKIRLALKLRVPSDETPAYKQSTIIITANG